jgi:hypothetical protein
MRHYPAGVVDGYPARDYDKYQRTGADSGRWKESNTLISSLHQIKRYLLGYWPSSNALPVSNTSGRRSPMSRIIHLPKPPLPAIIPPEASGTIHFILLCSLWYTTSALSSNTGKAIMTQFRYPVTLTFVQFGFVALYCLLIMSPAIRFSRLRKPTRAIIRNTLPMGLFQVGGHIFSSLAISRIPVSTVHTIKVRCDPFLSTRRLNTTRLYPLCSPWLPMRSCFAYPTLLKHTSPFSHLPSVLC